MQEVNFSVSIVPFLFIHMNTGHFDEICRLQQTKSVLVAMRTTKETLSEFNMATEKLRLKLEQIMQLEVIMREKAIIFYVLCRNLLSLGASLEGQVHARGGHCAQDGEITVT